MCVIEYSASIISGETKAPIPREEKEIEANRWVKEEEKRTERDGSGRRREGRRKEEKGEEGRRGRGKGEGRRREGKKEGGKGREVEEWIVRDGGEDGGAKRNLMNVWGPA